MSERNSRNSRNIETALVFGGCGGFGKRFSRELLASEVAVTTVDVVAGADIVLDVTVDPQPLHEQLASSDLILLCLNESQTLKVLPVIADLVAADSLLADICSVKTKIAELVLTLNLTGEYVSLHPMFGPDRPIKGSNAVFVPLIARHLADSLRKMLESWQLNVIEADAAQHDAVTAMVQVVPHALLLSFAQMRSEMRLPEDLIQAFATPIFRDLDDVSQRLVGENPELYHNIQSSNPNARLARQELVNAVTRTVATLADEDPGLIKTLFERAYRK